MSFPNGNLAMVIWYRIERDYFSDISALSISPTKRALRFVLAPDS